MGSPRDWMQTVKETVERIGALIGSPDDTGGSSTMGTVMAKSNRIIDVLDGTSGENATYTDNKFEILAYSLPKGIPSRGTYENRIGKVYFENQYKDVNKLRIEAYYTYDYNGSYCPRKMEMLSGSSEHWYSGVVETDGIAIIEHAVDCNISSATQYSPTISFLIYPGYK